jgi:outer membrane protein OmpA-like peptidoglycan-associated protein
VLHALTAVAGVAVLGYGIVVGTDASAAHAGTPIASAAAPSPTTSQPTIAMATPPAAVPTATGETRTVTGTPAAPTPTPPPGPPVSEGALPPGPAWTPIVFDSASATLDAQAQSILSQVVKDLQAHPEVTLVEVQGHADERGNSGQNNLLTMTRASAALEFLVARGVARSRLRRVAYGARCPADPACEKVPAPSSCHEASSWQHDRRVTLVVLKAGSERFTGKVACDRGMSLATARPR